MPVPAIPALGASILLFDGLLNGAAQFKLQAFDLHRRRGPNIDAHFRRLRNGVDRRAAFNDSNVESRFRRSRNPGLREQMNRVSQRDYRIGCTKVAPGMAAWATD